MNINTRFVYKNSKGDTEIVRPQQWFFDKEADPNWSQDEMRDYFLKKCVLPFSADGTFHELSQEHVPLDRHFRHAWESDGKQINVNMKKAKEIHQDRLRAMRAPKLQELDIAYMRAMEEGDITAQTFIAQKKQQLRDVTEHPDVIEAKTPDELKAAVPSVLTESYNF